VELQLPPPYVARPYRGAADHPAMVAVRNEYCEHVGDPETTTLAQFDVAYANLVNCEPEHDIAIIEDGEGAVAGYTRAWWEDREAGSRDCVFYSPIGPEHLGPELFWAVIAGQERNVARWAADRDARYFTFCIHPGPDCPPTGEAAWLESAGYSTIRFGAYLVRPHLHDIPDLRLPAGVEVRPVTEDQLRAIWEAHWEAFRGSFDFREATEADFNEFRDDPLRDETLWKIAWAGDRVVGQVKTYVNDEQNAQRGTRLGWTEYISTHAEWRNRGIAGALLAMSLRELRDRGYEQAALGVDTQNPGGAFQLYTKLGFELQRYEAVYAKPVSSSVSIA
jgi:ribosomal protein S18 acetylase RimI-like enzyme